MKKQRGYFRFSTTQWVYLLLGVFLLASFMTAESQGVRLLSIFSLATWTYRSTGARHK